MEETKGNKMLINLMPNFVKRSPTKKRTKTPEKKTRKTSAKQKSSHSYVMPRHSLQNYIYTVIPILDSFNNKYNEEYNNSTCDYSKGKIAFKAQQQFVSEYIKLYTPYRGLVLWHGLGSGKTLSAISIAEQIISDVEKDMENQIKKNKKYSILFISPAMLVSNFDTEIQKYDEFYKSNEIYGENYTGFTSNGKLTTYSKMENPNLFKNRVIIIDESQILISSITNALMDNKPDSRLAHAYKEMMREETSKIVCLSGTPIDKRPAELAVLFNLLVGVDVQYYLTNITLSDIHKNFSEDPEFANSTKIYNNGNTTILTRLPIYFINGDDNKLKYSSTQNAYTREEYFAKLKQIEIQYARTSGTK